MVCFCIIYQNMRRQWYSIFQWNGCQTCDCRIVYRKDIKLLEPSIHIINSKTHCLSVPIVPVPWCSSNTETVYKAYLFLDKYVLYAYDRLQWYFSVLLFQDDAETISCLLPEVVAVENERLLCSLKLR